MPKLSTVSATGASLVLVTTIALTAPVRADQLISGFEGEAKVQTALKASNPELAKSRAELTEELRPVVVLVPGIMGSKLINKATGKTIWGTIRAESNDGSNLSYDVVKDVDVAVLDQFDAIVKNQPVYIEGQQKISEYIADTPNKFLAFPYDWRQDNRLSAEQLDNWICDHNDKLADRNVVFLAHSMGGLVTKYWVKTYRNARQTCADGKPYPKFRSTSIAFVGVPFLGAPKALGTFVEGFAHTGSEFGTVFGQVDRDFISRYVSNYGYTFQSAYQLLPVYRDCLDGQDSAEAARSLPPYMQRKLSDGSEKLDDDIFSASLWKEMDWPRYHDSRFDAATFYQTYLPEKLKNANAFQCELARYALPADISITYFAANGPGKTPTGYRFETTSGWWTGPGVKVTPLMGQGDQTVPWLIANGALFGADSNMRRGTGPLIAHMNLLDSFQVWDFIRGKFDDATREVNQQMAQAVGSAAAVTRAYVQAAALPPVPLDHATNPQLASVNDEITKAVLASKSLDAKAAYDLARETTGDVTRTALYSYLGRQTSQPIVAASARKDLAHQQFERGLWDQATETTAQIKQSPEWTSVILADRPELATKVMTIDGWAKLKAGNLDAAESVLSEAAKRGSTNALSGLKELQTQRGIYLSKNANGAVMQER